MIKVLSVFGTRPEAIKMAPVVKELSKFPGEIVSQVAVTAQHREMLDQVLDLFHIVPDYDLNLMRHGQTLYDITAGALLGLKDILTQEKPDLVLVHGDTTTTFVAALAAYYQQIKVGHVEAGLRTGNKYAPFPEEMNRRMAGSLADYHFAPTETSKKNLLRENVPEESIIVTGNTVIDALLETVGKEYCLTGLGLDQVNWKKKILLVTCHRRENWGAPMARVFQAIRKIKEMRPDTEVIFPVHKNPLVRDLARDILCGTGGIHLIEPLDYQPFSNLMAKSYLVLTDSGGMQEEVPSLGKPVLVLRDTTERPEALEAGTVKLVGTDGEKIIKETVQLIDNPHAYHEMANAVNPYGDGKASGRIVRAILKFFRGNSC
ncbi:non-hydrolyzing UDP-N-acetylglucosamine 2-epimerase [Candidatus Formimonas warabiya]|uniref:UDP-N-acetylglucosamine 2-epimerase (non-hydrolyzing) n=1 Tax=Formimonas warabiya TaxID=1761012 RepID=A0A3G1KU94_FORW1|nr:UDP-N-acetylglucosamine 2-epimerase (non-hydrolyzing) [Candidatus Formimonas warabiya]ATW25984.1 UDP-N-acetylglucosamine 2-epimerase [Candidatus Formimonas warabiya]